MYFSLSVWSIAFARQTNRIARQTKRSLRPLVLGTLFRARSLGSRGALCDEPKTHKTENLGFQSKIKNPKLSNTQTKTRLKIIKSRRKNNNKRGKKRNPTDAVLYQFRTFCWVVSAARSSASPS
jgi:hypothetical protein